MFVFVGSGGPCGTLNDVRFRVLDRLPPPYCETAAAPRRGFDELEEQVDQAAGSWWFASSSTGGRGGAPCIYTGSGPLLTRTAESPHVSKLIREDLAMRQGHFPTPGVCCARDLPLQCMRPGADVTHTMAVGGVTHASARSGSGFRRPIPVSGRALARSRLRVHDSPENSATRRPETATIIDISGPAAGITCFYYRAVIRSVPNRGAVVPDIPGYPCSIRVHIRVPAPANRAESLLPSPTPPGNTSTGRSSRPGPEFLPQLGDWGYPDSVDNMPPTVLPSPTACSSARTMPGSRRRTCPSSASDYPRWTRC